MLNVYFYKLGLNEKIKKTTHFLPKNEYQIFDSRKPIEIQPRVFFFLFFIGLNLGWFSVINFEKKVYRKIGDFGFFKNPTSFFGQHFFQKLIRDNHTTKPPWFVKTKRYKKSCRFGILICFIFSISVSFPQICQRIPLGKNKNFTISQFHASQARFKIEITFIQVSLQQNMVSEVFFFFFFFLPLKVTIWKLW